MKIMQQYITMKKRILSLAIDSVVLLLARVIVGFFGAILLLPYRAQFVSDFISKFALATPEFTEMEHVYFFFRSSFGHSAILLLTILLLLGFLYHVVTLSKWHASLGQHVAGLYLAHSQGKELSIARICMRTVISYIPWILLPLMFYWWHIQYKILSFGTMTLLCFWHDLRIFCGKKIALHDLLTDTHFQSIEDKKEQQSQDT